MKPFQFKQFAVDQSNGVFKIGTDGCLLAAEANVENAYSILDIGTGTGVIALMIAQRNSKASITAIDVNPQAVNLAKKNFNQSPYGNRLRCFQADFINDFNPDCTFDAIVCNPPFFKDSLVNNDLNLAQARHDLNGGIVEMLPKVNTLLRPNGNISLIIPRTRVEELLNVAEASSLFLSKRIDISPFPNKPANRTILQFCNSHVKTQHFDFVLYREQNVLSAEARRLLKPFYLNL